jgi:hypothetical protein
MAAKFRLFAVARWPVEQCRALTATASELDDPQEYPDRILADLEAKKMKYRLAEDDPEGCGIGTFHGISAKLSAVVKDDLQLADLGANIAHEKWL